MELGGVAGWQNPAQRRLDRLELSDERRRGRCLSIRKAACCVPTDLKLRPTRAVLVRPDDRQCIEHLVGQKHALDRHCGQHIEPAHPVEQLGYTAAQHRPLALAQLSTPLEDRVGCRQLTALRQSLQQVRSERPTPGPQFEQPGLRSQLFQPVRARGSQCAAEQRRQLGRRHKIALSTELGGAGTVVTQPGRIKRKLHVAVETDSAAGLCHLGGNMCAEPSAMRQRGLGRKGKIGS